MVRRMTLFALTALLACTPSTLVDDGTDAGKDTNPGDTAADDSAGTGLEIGVYGGAALFINEVMPDIVKNEDDPSASGDWLEIYNPGGSAVSLDGYYLDRNKLGLGAAWAFPAGESVAANAWYLVGLDSFPSDTDIDVVTDFHSSWKADLLWLYVLNADGTAGVADRAEWTQPVIAPESLARSPDGGEFAHTTHPTPGAANQ